ncbi:hypothetical protein [Desulforhopalus sp. 52FAK]
MSNSFFIAGSIFAAWLLSPEALVLVSNLAGTNGLTAPLFILGAALISYLALLLTNYQSEQEKTFPGEEIILHSFGLAAAGTLAIFLPTGMLVTAGFTFNETFLYWFPNFGFSATLLIVVLLIQLTGEFAVQVAQRLFSSIAAMGVFTIILVGLLSQTGTATPELHSASREGHYFTHFTFSLLLFLGSWHPALRSISPIQLFCILLGGALFISLWQIVAIHYVPGEKLANSTIAYIFVAREVMGQAGRIIIGITIISGTCAAVNYFFSLTTRYSRKLLNPITTSSTHKVATDRLIVLLLATMIAICMASGLAGEPHLEIYIFASLLLWLMSAAVRVSLAWLRTRKIVYTILPATFILAPFYLIMTHEDSTSLVIFIALALCPSFIISSAVTFLGKRAH